MTLLEELREMQHTACGDLSHHPQVVTRMYTKLLKHCGNNKLLDACMFGNQSLGQYAEQLFERHDDGTLNENSRSDFVPSAEFRELVPTSSYSVVLGRHVDVNEKRTWCSWSDTKYMAQVFFVFTVLVLLVVVQEVGKVFVGGEKLPEVVYLLGAHVVASGNTLHTGLTFILLTVVLLAGLYGLFTLCRLIVLNGSKFLHDSDTYFFAKQVRWRAEDLDRLIKYVRARR